MPYTVYWTTKDGTFSEDYADPIEAMTFANKRLESGAADVRVETGGGIFYRAVPSAIKSSAGSSGTDRA